MFRPIRKKKNEISTDEALALLQDSRRGVLAVNGDDGYPYAIPVNYYFDKENRKIYFHGARVGHKVDALRACDKICFTVYGHETIKEEAWAPFMQSVWQMPSGRSRREGYGNVEAICHEILSK